MSATTPRKGGSDDFGTAVVWTAVALLVGTILVTNGAVRLTSDVDRPGVGGWIGMPVAVYQQTVPWTDSATLVAAGICLLVAVLGVAMLVLSSRRPGKKQSIDRAAPHMAGRKDLPRFTKAGAAATAKRLGVEGGFIGFPLGPTVAGGTELFADVESSAVDISGPRTGKTTRYITWVCEAPGACMVTSNRRDIVDDTRDVRADRGTVWVFDPQKIVGEEPTFWFDFRAYILSGPAGSEVKAQSLAGIFAATAAKPESKEDGYFDPEGTELVGHLLHAAALDNKPITQTYLWATSPKDATPAHTLTKHGFPLSAAAINKVVNAADKERSGIFGSAKRRLSFLTNVSAHPWITPGGQRRRFDPDRFARSQDTLYLVSREGVGSLSALTTAMTVATFEAAENLAIQSPGGRLEVPMLAALDEAANVARDPHLPARFSHYGGRGIFLLVVLQSPSQGESVWGKLGMAAMWSAALIRVYGGGVSEAEKLAEWARLAGTYRPQQVTTSSSKNGRTVGRSEGKDDVLEMGDLAGLPPGRTYVMPTGARPTLVIPRPWWATKWKAAVQASHDRNDPTARAKTPVPAPTSTVVPAERDVDTRAQVVSRWTTP